MSNICVAVSGVTGYIGAQIALDLLKKGYIVHGTVRRNTPERVAHLTEPNTTGELKVFEADLIKPGSFDKAVEGCMYAIHVASPFMTESKDPQRELIEPAVEGTLTFLESCLKAGVKKVVLTSSGVVVASRGDHHKVYNEDDWDTESSLKILPYYLSKRKAEQAAWKFVEEKAPNMKLVVINPLLVEGPSLVKSLSESQSIIQQVINGLFPGIIDLGMKTVDVRDVSLVHITAMENENAHGRYLCCQPHPQTLSMRDLFGYCREAGFTMPKLDLTNPIFSQTLKLLSYVSPGGQAGVYVRRHLAIPLMIDSSKVTNELGIVFRDQKETIMDMIKDMIEKGHIKDPQSS